MPRISEFYGVAIYMYYRDHGIPHFHAIYGEHEAIIDLESFAVIRGSLSSRALGLVREWASQHRAELRENWRRCRSGRPLVSIAPLE